MTTTSPCIRFTLPTLDDPRYYADMCHNCGHLKRDHPEFAGTCQHCGTVAPTENWGGTHDSLSLARNQSLIQRWCRRCILTAQVAHMRPMVERLAEAERELAALVSNSSTTAPEEEGARKR